MRYLTIAEHQLLESLEPGEAEVVRFFLVELDARLVTEGDQHRGERISSNAPGPAVSPSVTSQQNLWGEAA